MKMFLPILVTYRTALLALVVAVIQLSCDASQEIPATDLSQESIIPKPVSVTATHTAFALTDETTIYVEAEGDELQKNAQYLADKLRPATGFELAVRRGVATPEETSEEGNIYLSVSAKDAQLGEEGYELTIGQEAIRLKANQPAGIFRGIQTLRQLLPAAIASDSVQPGPWYVASGTIRDYPEYGYRGVMLDVARHFFAPEDVRQYLDYIAYYKMNAMHLHLADDQGWRIEIKSWPRLATHGGSMEVGGTKGGYYTQQEYAEIVAYARDRYITIIPEIDMPGHTNAALASYPELNCNGKAPALYTGIEVGFSTLCTKKEITYQFIDDVIKELSALTPGPYIHIGGDESHATPMKDYIPFVNRVQKIVRSHGKQVMGWDEIAHAELTDSAVVQYWAVAENAQKAVEQGAKVLMSPATRAYMDMQYDSTSQYGLHWAAYIETDSAYLWDPATLVKGIGKESILGIEAPLWTETITDMEALEYMVFPRLPGYAEIGWTASNARSWEGYQERLAAHQAHFEAMDINYYPSRLIPWKQAQD